MKEEKRGKIIIAVIAGFIICFLIFNQFSRSTNKFSSQKWKEGGAARNEMVDDIVRSKMLEGKSKEETIIILGQPSEYEDKGKRRQNAKTMRYDLGIDLFGEFNTYLCVDLDNNRVVLAYKYHQKN